MPKKDGLDAALDFTKYMLAICGAVLAFLLGSNVLPTLKSMPGKIALTIAALLFAVSVGAGLFVLARGSTMLSEGEYSLQDAHIRIPGTINILAFFVAILCVAICVAIMIWFPGSP